MTHPQRLWNMLTAPHAADEDVARREYMTRVNLVVLGGIVHCFTLVAFIGSLFGLIPFDTPFLLAIISLILIAGWWLAKFGHWRVGGYFPPVMFLLAAIYGNFIGGVDAPAMLLYALAIVLAATLQERRGQIGMLALCLGFYLGLGLAHGFGLLTALRSAQTAFLNRVSIAIAAMAGITGSVWFLSDQFQAALKRARTLAEEARANAENASVFKTLVENAVNGIAMSGLDGRLTFVNRAGYALGGYDPAGESLIGTPLTTFVPDDGDVSTVDTILAEALAGGWSGEVRLKRKDGSVFDGHLVGFPVSEETGHADQVGVILEDITERKRAEQALRESEEELRTLVESVPAAFYRCEVNLPWRMLYINPGIYAITGHHASEFDRGGLPYAEVILPEDLGTVALNVEAGVAQRQHYELEYRIRHRDGSTRWVYERGRAIYGEDGQPLYLHGILIDINERKQMERRSQLQERLAVVGQLAAGIAHDFNNIMATISLYSDLLLRESSLSPKGQQRAQTVNQQARRAADLISQILDFSRWSVMEMQPLILVPFLKEFVNLLARILPENIRLSLDYDRADCVIGADPTRMQQVLMNLALNARDAMPGGGDLRFALSTLLVESEGSLLFPNMTPGEWVKITVADTGTGIAPDILAHIFEPFFTTKRPGEGTGLGLAQVYGIVNQHGGYVDVTSQAGRGTEFTLYFPLFKAPPPVEVEESAEVPAGAGEVILVVEDGITTREALVETLASLGYAPLTAGNGEEALRVLEAQAVDLVLTDLIMPVMGGQALCEVLIREYPALKAILMTGYPLTGETRAFLEAEHIPCIQKPIGLHDIARLIRETLDG